VIAIWVDAQLSPGIARWIRESLGLDAVAVRDLGLRDAEDAVIFEAARGAGVVVLIKDSDFVDLVLRRGSPPQVLWLTCGNTSNARLRTILKGALLQAIQLLEQGETLVEISDRADSAEDGTHES
jgi:predicted nuclease of predicted toxin-antitoxin system